MGFIEYMTSEHPDAAKLSQAMENACTYPDFFLFWKENLFERIMRLFIWDNTGEVDPKEIEERLMLAGHCGIADYEGLTAFFGSFFGVTKYQDEWTGYNVHSPIYSNTYTIDKDIAIINNNSLRNAMLPHVIHYAQLLAHADVTLIKQLVEARDPGGVPIAQNEKVKQSLISYQRSKFNGKAVGFVSDLAGVGVSFLGSDKHSALDINAVWDVRTKLIKSFYADIGVRASFDKKSNAVVDEITSDTSMLLYNISDMLKEREKGAERVNKLFGTNWSVRISDEIDYTRENAPEDVPAEEVSDDVSAK